jgi:hypothetical protein
MVISMTFPVEEVDWQKAHFSARIERREPHGRMAELHFQQNT